MKKRTGAGLKISLPVTQPVARVPDKIDRPPAPSLLLAIVLSTIIIAFGLYFYRDAIGYQFLVLSNSPITTETKYINGGAVGGKYGNVEDHPWYRIDYSYVVPVDGKQKRYYKSEFIGQDDGSTYNRFYYFPFKVIYLKSNPKFAYLYPYDHFDWRDMEIVLIILFLLYLCIGGYMEAVKSYRNRKYSHGPSKR